MKFKSLAFSCALLVCSYQSLANIEDFKAEKTEAGTQFSAKWVSENRQQTLGIRSASEADKPDFLNTLEAKTKRFADGYTTRNLANEKGFENQNLSRQAANFPSHLYQIFDNNQSLGYVQFGVQPCHNQGYDAFKPQDLKKMIEIFCNLGVIKQSTSETDSYKFADLERIKNRGIANFMIYLQTPEHEQNHLKNVVQLCVEYIQHLKSKEYKLPKQGDIINAEFYMMGMLLHREDPILSVLLEKGFVYNDNDDANAFYGKPRVMVIKQI